jgi:DNA repair exonuclease SbcCD nuclease subunit
MTRWRFVHAADLHLDSPFVGLGEVQPELARQLTEATFAALTRLADLCLAEGAAFLLLAGDLFDQPQGSLKAQLRLRRELSRLAYQGIETFIVHGNHDHAGSGGLTLNWPDGVTVFPQERVDLAEVKRQGATLARIYGISHGGPAEAANLAAGFPEAKAGPLAIGLLHANLDHNAEHGDYAPCTLADLAKPGYDYWALGHIHRPGVRRAAQPAVVYAGNPQGRHLKEPGPRGCYLVEVDGHQVTPHFRPLAPIGWDEAGLDLGEARQVDQVLAALQDLVAARRPRPPDQGVILRLNLTGRSPVHHDLQRAGIIQELVDDLRYHGFSSTPWVWVASLAAATGPDLDLDSLRQGQNLAAAVLTLLDEARKWPIMPPYLKALLDPVYRQPLAQRYLTEAPAWPGLADEVAAALLSRLLPEED